MFFISDALKMKIKEKRKKAPKIKSVESLKRVEFHTFLIHSKFEGITIKKLNFSKLNI